MHIYLPSFLFSQLLTTIALGWCRTLGWQECEIKAVTGKRALPLPPDNVSIPNELTRKTP